VGANLLRRQARFRTALDQLQDVIGLVCLAALVSTTLSATIGVTSLWLTHLVSGAMYGRVWFSWWLGDAMGALVITPVLLAWRAPPHMSLPRYRLAEAILLGMALAVASLLAFSMPVRPELAQSSLAFIVFPFLIWAALRFGQRGAASATLLTISIAIWGTIRSTSFVDRARLEENLIYLHAFMATAAVTTMLLAVALAERTRMQETLRESQALLQAVFDHSTTIIYVKDLQGRFMLINRRFEALFHVTREATLGKTDHDIFPPAYADRFHANDQHVLESRTALETEEIAPHDDGPHTYISIKCPLYDEAGQPYAICGISTDITERKRAEQALGESDARFQGIFANAAIGIALCDLEGRVVESNPAFQTMLLYSAEELRGKSFSDITHPDDIQRDWDLAIELIAGKRDQYDLEKRYYRKDRQLMWAHLIMSLIRDANGIPQYAVGMVEDITKRKRLEAQLFQAQKMEALGILAGGIAHDFNNLLTAIIGYADLALLGMPSDHPVHSDLRDIVKAGQRAATLTQQVLAFARKQVVDPHVLNLNILIVDLDKMLCRLLGEDIELVTRPAPDLGQVKVDPGQIEQVIVNLAVNARDAMPRGGKLTIETANTTLDANYAARHVGVTPGAYVIMDTVVLQHIFEPFFTTKEPGKGSGLGLATSYGIVKQHGGNIWVYSEVDRGTTFKIYLPRVEESAAPALPDEAKTVSRGSETVLLVEDERLVQELASRVLREQGYTVLEATNGDDALRMVQAYAGAPIALLVTDVVMPRMGGKALAAQVTSLQPRIKVLFISGYATEAISQHGRLEPGTNFLSKPFTPGALIRKVREVLDTR
jgi:PAS domain S-box-containing protein